MEKQAYAAIRQSKDTGKEFFLANEINIDQEVLLSKKTFTDTFNRDNPIVRIAVVKIETVD